MHSFTKRISKNKTIKPNKLILNEEKNSLMINNRNIKSKLISFSKKKIIQEII